MTKRILEYKWFGDFLKGDICDEVEDIFRNIGQTKHGRALMVIVKNQHINCCRIFKWYKWPKIITNLSHASEGIPIFCH